MESVQEENLVDAELPQPIPWYRDPDSKHPFKLYMKHVVGDIEPDALQTLAFFPWEHDSLSRLWEGSIATEENLAKWKGVVDKFRDTLVVCADSDIYILWLRRRKHPLRLKIPKFEDMKLILPDKTHAAWVLSPNRIDEPCIVFSKGSLLWIYNPVLRGISSYLRGHGGAITSLAVHSLVPNLFCSTSRDHTTRIYDLTLRPHGGFKDQDTNPHWPPGTLPSRAGAAHGLHMNEPEGEGIGRCIVVLQGGRSGGHNAAVLGASFHPNYPVIATCGVDRRINIWHIHPRNSQQITREDKPLFSSSRIHRSRVISVRWLSHDTLMSHSPSAILRTEPLDYEKKATALAPGEIVVWKWLALNRFFPPRYDEMRAEGKPENILRGCASDYQESSSFEFKATGAFPRCRLQVISPSVHLFGSPVHDPIATCVIPSGIHYWKKSTARTGGHLSNSQVEHDGEEEIVPLVPPDEISDLTRSSNGITRKLAGTVTLVHIPSLPLRLPSRFPLDNSTDTRLGAQRGQNPELKLSGLSEINPGLIERENPPPISGWTLEVPLDEDDSVYESPQTSDLAMEVDAQPPPEAPRVKGKGNAPTSRVPAEPEGNGIKVRLITAAMGMGGKVVAVLGTRGRIWVYRMSNSSTQN